MGLVGRGSALYHGRRWSWLYAHALNDVVMTACVYTGLYRQRYHDSASRGHLQINTC